MAIKIVPMKWISKYMHIKDFPICCKFFCKNAAQKYRKQSKIMMKYNCF